MAKRIYVSREYEQPFHAVSTLIRGGTLSDRPYRVLADGAIFDGTYEYELTSRAGSVQQNVTHRFAEDGATWFAPLRGQVKENDDAVWLNFMVSVREEYHRGYSVLEYAQEIGNTGDSAKTEQEVARQLVMIVKRFFPHLDPSVADVRPIRGERMYEDVFGVSMRVELSAESTSGASLPLLCKVYFVRSGRIIKPISWKVAKQYDRDILNIVPEGDDSKSGKADPNVIEETLTAFDRLVKEPEVNFADYTWLGEIEMPSTDEEERAANQSDANSGEFTENQLRQRSALRKLYVQLTHDKLELQCQRVDVLYISHIKILTSAFDLYHQGKPLLRAQVGVNNTLTVQCLSCDQGAVLIDRDEIVYEADGEQHSVVLDRNEDTLGISNAQVAEILTRGELGNHLKHIRCRADCSRVRCISQLFEADGEHFCEDCHCPEVVYTDYNGKRYHTPSLLVVTDRLTVVPSAQKEDTRTGRCRICGRYFSADGIAPNGACKSLCARAISGEEPRAAAKLYRRYSGMFSFKMRLFGERDRRCYEDGELLLFVIGNKKYLFNKLNADERGYLEMPKCTN